jgi:hypothetical protein
MHESPRRALSRAAAHARIAKPVPWLPCARRPPPRRPPLLCRGRRRQRPVHALPGAPQSGGVGCRRRHRNPARRHRTNTTSHHHHRTNTTSRLQGCFRRRGCSRLQLTPSPAVQRHQGL